jgi:hypothetical protein
LPLKRGLRLPDGSKNSIAVHSSPIIAILLKDDKKKDGQGMRFANSERDSPENLDDPGRKRKRKIGEVSLYPVRNNAPLRWGGVIF